MFRPYHPANFSLISTSAWKVIILAWLAKLLDVQFHIEGIPFGGKYRGAKGGGNEGQSEMQSGLT